MRLQEVAKAVHGRLVGDDVFIAGVTTDTRTLRQGELFVALRGSRFDGHRFVVDAAHNNAAAALIDEQIETVLSTVQVDDTKAALGELARHWRNRFDIPLIGVTGSNGKTTVKEMLGAILNRCGKTLVTSGNLNNEIGVPLTLLRLRDDHRYAVVEMGTNHIGEIDYLSRMARPTVAVITNAAAAHLEGLGNVESVAKAKAEIFHGLGRDGVAIINADDPYAPLWRTRARPRRCRDFALRREASVAADFETGTGSSTLRLRTPIGDVELSLPLPGEHNVANALAAACAAIAVGTGLDQVKAGLEQMAPVRGRLQVRRGVRGSTVYDDTYNANPASVRAAVDVISARSGTRLLVLGDMAELGSQEKTLHRDIGRYARDHGVDGLLALGPLSTEAVEAFGDGGSHFESEGGLIRVLRNQLDEHTTVLVKGSRSMHMERIIEKIVEPNGGAATGSAH